MGGALDRERARTLARCLRRRRAEHVALRVLARREHSRASLEARLERASVAPADRRDLVERATSAGLVDDARFAEARARTLAERGAGDLLVLDDLERHGVEPELSREAVASLEPEAARAARIVAARGPGARTVRYLAARGFSEASLEPFVADVEGGALP